MLYELIAVVRPGRLNEVKEVAKAAGSIVLQRRGVVRGFTNWGTFLLPKPTTHLEVKYHTGHYFIMRFDASAETQHAVQRTLRVDPRLIRHGVVKMGKTLQDLSKVGGVAEWAPSDRSQIFLPSGAR